MEALLMSPLETDTPETSLGAQDPEPEVYALPCSVAQKGFWVLDQLAPGNPAGNVSVRFKVTGPLSVAALEASFEEIASRHESLRTRFAWAGNEPVQVIHPELRLPLHVKDLRHLPPDQGKAEAERLAAEEAVKPLNLRQLPLLRIRLLRLAEEEHMLLMTVHHAVADGWSIGLITEELSRCYARRMSGEQVTLPVLEIQYADYAVWERERLSSGELDAQLAYWQEKLRGAPSLDLPTDLPRRPEQTFHGEIRSLVLPRALTDALQGVSRRGECTLFVTLLAALHVILARWSGQMDLLVGTLVAGRHRVELEKLIGTFVNSLPLRTNLGGDPTFLEVVGRLRSTVLEAFENQDVPFETLLEKVRPQRGRGAKPLFRFNTIYQRDFVKVAPLGKAVLTPIPSKAAGAIYDLNFFLVERADGWRASIEFNTDLYRADTAQALLEQFQNLLEWVAQQPDGRLSAFHAELDRIQAPFGRPGTAAESPAVPEQRAESKSALTAKVTRVWEEILAVSPIDPAADFFEIGGHSLLALRLLARVEKEFGKKISLASFLQTATITQMAAALEAGTGLQPSSIVTPIRTGGENAPLFLIHGVGGTVVALGSLVQYLDRRWPAYAVQSPPLEDGAEAPEQLEEMAAQYVSEIRKVQPEGPYYFLGYSLGGLIAFEMAQQLHRSGQRVALLGMLDTYQIGYWNRVSGERRWRARLSESIRIAAIHWKAVWNGPNRIEYLKGRVKSKAATLLAKLPREYRPALVQKLATRDNLNAWAARRYREKPYPGSLTLFRAADREHDGFDYLLGWGGLAKAGIEVFDIPGRHETINKEPNVRVLADRLQFVLEKASQLGSLSKRYLES